MVILRIIFSLDMEFAFGFWFFIVGSLICCYFAWFFPKENFNLLDHQVCRNPTFGRVTLPKWGLRSPPGLPKLQSSIAGIKTPRFEAFFMSLESYWSANVENGLAWAIWTSTAQVMEKKKGRESNWQFDSRPLKVGNRPNPSVCRWSAAHHWKDLNKSYKFALDLIPIQGLNKELWIHKIPGVQTETISKLLLGSPGTKSHLDVGAAE